MADRGSALPAVLGLLIGGGLVLAVAVDLTRWASASREAVFVADAAAQAGAAMVSEPGLRAGLLVVDAERAEAAALGVAHSSRPRPGRSATVEVGDAEVCVAVRQPFESRVLAVIGAAPQDVHGRSCAVPAVG